VFGTSGHRGLEVLAANDVEVMIARNDEYTPTPAVSHAILKYNRGRTAGLADGARDEILFEEIA
jgi:phosphoglucomutase